MGNVIFFIFFILLSACHKKQVGYGLLKDETIRLTLETEPPTLDWTKADDMISGIILNNLMDGLIEYNLDDPELSLRPALATDWSASEDAKRWTFHLRKDVRWTDGVQLTAQHVLDGWERLLNPKTACDRAYNFFAVKNAHAYNQGKIKDFSQVGFHANDHEIIVDLEQSQSFFPYQLTNPSTYPIRKDLIEKYGDHWTDPQSIQTLGPYKLQLWSHDNALVLTRNDPYYGTPAKTKNILFYIIGESSTSLNLFELGQLDGIDHLSSVQQRMLSHRKDFYSLPRLFINYYAFNILKKPMNDVRVRQAIAMAIDRKEITQILGEGTIPLKSFVPPGMFGFEPNIGLDFNPAKANALLDQAGFKDRKRFPKIELEFNTQEDHQRVAENVQAQLKKNLDISIELRN